MVSIWRVFLSERGDKERNAVVLKNDAFFFFTYLDKSLIFQLFPFVFDSPHGSIESFVLVALPLNARSDQ